MSFSDWFIHSSSNTFLRLTHGSHCVWSTQGPVWINVCMCVCQQPILTTWYITDHFTLYMLWRLEADFGNRFNVGSGASSHPIMVGCINCQMFTLKIRSRLSVGSDQPDRWAWGGLARNEFGSQWGVDSMWGQCRQYIKHWSPPPYPPSQRDSGTAETGSLSPPHLPLTKTLHFPDFAATPQKKLLNVEMKVDYYEGFIYHRISIKRGWTPQTGRIGCTNNFYCEEFVTY